MARLFRVAVPTSILILLVSEFVFLTSAYILAAYLVLEVDPAVFLLYDNGLLRIMPVVLSVLFALHFLDLYADIRTRSRIALVLELGQAFGFAFLVQALISYLSTNWMLPRWLMIYGAALGLFSLAIWRIFYEGVVLRAIGSQRVMFLGTNPVVQEVTEYMAEHPELGLANIGYLDDVMEPGQLLNGAKVLGPTREISQVVSWARPDRIVVGMSERRASMPVYDLLDLRFSGILIEEAASMYENARGRICTKELRPSQLVFSAELGPRPASVQLQSIYSFLIAFTGFIVSLPVMLLTALAVKLTSPGPVLFRQTRVGLNGKLFTVFKFRSMRADAEAATGAVWAKKNDPRVTPVGRWLRKLRLDELPQFINVLKGDMSIVGPRPERPEFVKVLSEKIPYYRQRHCVKPGVTGWAQINHKYGDTIEDTIIKLEYDLYYIKHLSLSLDLYIIFHTLKTMLRSRGAQ